MRNAPGGSSLASATPLGTTARRPKTEQQRTIYACGTPWKDRRALSQPQLGARRRRLTIRYYILACGPNGVFNVVYIRHIIMARRTVEEQRVDGGTTEIGRLEMEKRGDGLAMLIAGNGILCTMKERENEIVATVIVIMRTVTIASIIGSVVRMAPAESVDGGRRGRSRGT